MNRRAESHEGNSRADARPEYKDGMSNWPFTVSRCNEIGSVYARGTGEVRRSPASTQPQAVTRSSCYSTSEMRDSAPAPICVNFTDAIQESMPREEAVQARCANIWSESTRR